MSADIATIRRDFRWAAGLLLVVFLAAIAGCPPTKPSERKRPQQGGGQAGDQQTGERTIVAQVNGEQFTLRELERRIDGLPAYVRAKFRGPAAESEQDGSVQKRQEYLKGLLQFEVLADVAEVRGFGDDPQVRHLLKEALADRALREALRTEISMSDISSEAIEQAYRENIDEYRTPEQRRGMVIVTGSKKRARLIREELVDRDHASFDKKLEHFRMLASEVSVDPVTAKAGGAIGAIAPPNKEDAHPRIAEVVYGLDERGEVSEVFELDGQWYVAMWADRRAASTTPLAQVEREIRTELYDKRKAELREKIQTKWRDGAEVEHDDGLASRLEQPPAGREVHLEDIPLVSTSEIDEK
ncbi:MAG: peptidyl-prolyl cis-trans isomerase [Bradymonadaceae bacterium]